MNSERQEEIQQRKREELEGKLKDLREELSSAQGELTELLQPAFDDLNAVDARRDEIESAIKRTEIDCGDCEGQLSAAIGDLYQENPPPKRCPAPIGRPNTVPAFPGSARDHFRPLSRSWRRFAYGAMGARLSR